MKKLNLLFTLILLSTIIACGDAPKKEDISSEKDSQEDKETSIKVYELEGSPQFPEAKISMLAPISPNVEEGEVEFAFKVENYNLKDKTENAGENGLANSPKGQHVHFILNNGPYSAHYEDAFMKDLPQGEHLVLAFLSRSYHESVKNKESYTLAKLSVGEPTEDQMLDVDFEAPHLFYSRPKGTYKGTEETDKVLLDFFLLNAELAADGHKVKATINGEEFMLDNWVPYVMEGLPMGENKVALELVDADGNFVEGPFNKVERTFTLVEADKEEMEM
jgi:hypothetical protein